MLRVLRGKLTLRAVALPWRGRRRVRAVSVDGRSLTFAGVEGRIELAAAQTLAAEQALIVDRG